MGFRKKTKEDIDYACANSFRYYDALRLLGLKTSGGNVTTLKSKIDLYGIDVSHFYINSGVGPRFGVYSKDISSLSSNQHRVRRICIENGWKCSSCGLEEWLGNKIPLELHHKDGDNCNNSENNICVLCPNCHALTENWRGRKLVP